MPETCFAAARCLAGVAHFARACCSPNENALTLPRRRLLAQATSALAAAGLVIAVGATSSFREPDASALAALPLQVPTVYYGLEVERFADVEESIAPSDATVADILRAAGVHARVAGSLARAAARKADLSDVGSRTTALFRGVAGGLRYVMQDLNPHEFLRVDVEAGRVEVANRDGVTAEYATAALYYGGDVDSMLAYVSFPDELRDRVRRAVTEELPLDEAFDGGILRLVYAVKRDESGRVIGHGDVEALRYAVDGEERTAIRFADAALDVEGFFQPDGTPVLRTWLESPVVDSWISSGFNLRRRHPVLKRIRPHYGTDYAARYGAPVLAMSDGVVVARAATRNNGNFVKLRHDDRYQTQYLHLKGFAPGIRPGAAVSKGQVIGYVGSTGLSSGPHVCLRFWRDGQQVDHRRLDLSTAGSLDAEAMAAFEARSELVAGVLDDRV